MEPSDGNEREDSASAPDGSSSKPKRKRPRARSLTHRKQSKVKDVSKITKKNLTNNEELSSKVEAMQNPPAPNAQVEGNGPRRTAGAAVAASCVEEEKEFDAEDDLEDQVDLAYLKDVCRGLKDDEIAHPKDKMGRKVVAYELRRQRRMGIYYFFSAVCNFQPESSGLWDGCNGIAAKIRDHMFLPANCDLRKIKAVLRVIMAHKDQDKKHCGDPVPRKEWGYYLIPLDSVEAQLIADMIEWEFGFSSATFFANWHREEKNLPHVGRSTTCEVVKRLKPVVCLIQKRGQGSFDVNSGRMVQSQFMVGIADENCVPAN